MPFLGHLPLFQYFRRLFFVSVLDKKRYLLVTTFHDWSVLHTRPRTVYNRPSVQFATLLLTLSSSLRSPCAYHHPTLSSSCSIPLFLSFFMAFSPSPKSSPKGATSSPSPTGQRTLTPQRKHRKMLKDGTSEVWPESVEKIFVAGTVIIPSSLQPSYLYVSPVSGLRQYWESPWATYSRGRSRWRNQFLVDYLKEAGIERSKKQVASHIQVLRNMWKGEKGTFWIF